MACEGGLLLKWWCIDSYHDFLEVAIFLGDVCISIYKLVIFFAELGCRVVRVWL